MSKNNRAKYIVLLSLKGYSAAAIHIILRNITTLDPQALSRPHVEDYLEEDQNYVDWLNKVVCEFALESGK